MVIDHMRGWRRSKGTLSIEDRGWIYLLDAGCWGGRRVRGEVRRRRIEEGEGG